MNKLLAWFNKPNNFLRKIIFAKFDWLKFIYSIQYKYIIAFYLAIFLLGRIFLYYDPLRLGLVHQLLLTGISIIVIISLKYAYTVTLEIEQACREHKGCSVSQNSKDAKKKTLEMIVRKMKETQKSVWWLLLMLYPLKGFVKKLFFMGYIQHNPTGYYAAVFGSSTFYLAMLGYTQVIVFIIYYAQMAHDSGKCLPLNFPADTIAPPKWFDVWNKLFNRIITLFFSIGTLFTFEYVLLMPKDIVILQNGKYILNPLKVPDPRVFFSSWATIFVFIIIAFPIGLAVIRHLQKKLVENMNNKIRKAYKKVSPNHMSHKHISDLWMLNYMSRNASIYSEVIRSNRNIIPIVSTIFSLLANIYKAYDSGLLLILMQYLKRIDISL